MIVLRLPKAAAKQLRCRGREVLVVVLRVPFLLVIVICASSSAFSFVHVTSKPSSTSPTATSPMSSPRQPQRPFCVWNRNNAVRKNHRITIRSLAMDDTTNAGGATVRGQRHRDEGEEEDASRGLPNEGPKQEDNDGDRIMRIRQETTPASVATSGEGQQQRSAPVEETYLQGLDSNEPSPSLASFLDSSSSQSSVWLLNFVAVLWGTQHAVIKLVVEDSDPGPFTFLRFGLAAVIASIGLSSPTPGRLRQLFPSAWDGTNSQQDDGDVARSSQQPSPSNAATNREVWRWGAEMGFWMFLGFSFQAIGLETTTAQRSGFLLYLNVKLVPFFARILLGRRISTLTWLSAFGAFTGTALLALQLPGGISVDTTTPSPMALSLNEGDWWSIAAAAASAMFILRLERAATKVDDASALNAACLWVVTILAGVWTVFVLQQQDAGGIVGAFEEVSSIASSHSLELLYLSGVTTALANWIQTKAQRNVPAEKACVIYAM